MNNNTFSISRTINLCRLYFQENRKFLLICALVIIGILISISLAITHNYDYHNISRYRPLLDPAIPSLIGFYTFLGYIFAALGGSFIFAGLKNKQGRISNLMIPALASEKLISRMLIYVLIYPLFFILAVCLAEFIRYSYLITTNPIMPVTPLYGIFSNPTALEYCTSSKFPVLVPCIIFFGVFAVQSFFILGSVLWPRYSSVKTFSVFFALTFIYIISVYILGEHLSKGKIYNSKPMIEIENHIAHIILLFEIAVCLFNWTMTWWRLKETDVITTKR